MTEVKITEGDLHPREARFAIVASRFNEFVVNALVKGSLDCLDRHGVDKNAIQIIKVPGAYEIPLAVSKLARAKRVDGIIALGAVIRGATSHFDYVSSECARGLSEIQSQEGIPVGFGVLMVDTLEQALERAGTKAGNKGEEATLAVIEMVNLLRKID